MSPVHRSASPRVQRDLERLRRWARLFDSAFRIPGTRVTFGIDPILGLIPGIGDLASPLLSLLIVWQAASLRVPKVVLVRIVLNALVDALFGAIPLIGDLFDFAWKANDWNLALLERHAMPGTPPTALDWLVVGAALVVVASAALIPIFIFAWLLGGVKPF